MKRLITICFAAVLFCTSSAIAVTWTTPQPVVNGINTSGNEVAPVLSFDGKSLYFTRDNAIYQATRSDPSRPFTSVSKVLYSTYRTVSVGWISPDNLRMYYYKETPDAWYLNVSTRASAYNSWTEGTVIPGLSSFSNPQLPRLTEDELTIVFDATNTTSGMGGYDIWMASRPDTSSPFGNIRDLSEINSSGDDQAPFLTPDGLTLYFSSSRNGSNQLFKTTRQSLSDPFSNLEHLSIFDSTYGSSTPSLSADGSTLFFCEGMSPNGYNNDIYYSEVPEPATLLLLGLGGIMLRNKR